MRDAVIVSTARTPIGKAYRGAFNNTHAVDMGGHVIQHAVERAGVERHVLFCYVLFHTGPIFFTLHVHQFEPVRLLIYCGESPYITSVSFLRRQESRRLNRPLDSCLRRNDSLAHELKEQNNVRTFALQY